MAGSSAGSIFVDLLLRDASYVQGLNRARNSTRQFGSNAQRDLAGAKSAFADVLNPVDNIANSLRGLAGIAAGALSVQQITRYSDTWKQLQGRLLIVEGSMENVGLAQEALSDIADRTRQSLEGVTSFYARLKQFIPEAERAQYDLLGVTESVSTALAITGETSASSMAAMIQFTQAVGTNFEAAGQELRSLQEQAPRLTQALMNALGDGTKSLQQLKDEGKLTRQSVLNALSGMGEEGRRLQEELAKVPVTVGQAFTQLDNAFLKYIGTSEAVTAGTSSLSIVIQTLAANIDFVAKALVGLAFIMTSRVVVAFVAAQAQALAYQLTLARMAGVSAAAATSVLALGTAARGLSFALAALGGPIGIAVIGVVTALTLHTNIATEAEGRYNDMIGKTAQEFTNFAAKSEDAKSKILENVESRISAITREKNEVEKLVLAYANLNPDNLSDALGVGVREFAGKVGIGTSPSEAIAKYEAAQKALEDLQRRRAEGIDPNNKPTTPPAVITDAQKKAAKELEKLYEKNRDVIMDLNKETLEYRDTEEELERLFKAKKLTLNEYWEALDNLDNKYDEASKKTKSFGFDLEEFGKEASRNLQDVFADFFMNMDDGFDGLVSGFAKALASMVANAAASNLAGLIFGVAGKDGKSSGGIFDGAGDFLGGLASSAGDWFKGLNLFADGGYLPPGQFGIAGEAGAELLYGGKTGVSVFNQDQVGGKGGNTYQFNVGTQVNQDDILRLQQMIIATAGPGVIEQRVSNAQMRGAL